MRLPDPEGGRDFLADRQALADVIVGLGLFGCLAAVHVGDHGRRDQIAFEAERRPGGHVDDGFARHDQTSLGIRTKRPMTSGGRTASTVTREAEPAAARSRA
jgi:hypothetical protein